MGLKHRTGHLLKKGKNFYCRWTIEGKVFVRSLRDENGNAITTKREAEEAQVKLMAPFAVASETEALESLVGKLGGRQAELARIENQQNPPLSINAAWTEFLASPNRPDSGPETLYQYECQWTKFAKWIKVQYPQLTSLNAVTREVAEDYAANLSEAKLSPNTYNKHLGLLTLVFRVLKYKAKLTDNPWQDIQRKHLVTHSRRELTVDELRRVCQSAKGELKTLLALGVYSGLRLGDCATLRWAETDLRRGIITRIPNKTGRRNPKPVLVPIHPVLLKMLTEVPIEQRLDYVLPETAALYQNRIDLVTDRIQAHFKASGIKPHKKGTGTDGNRAVIEVGFHSLRHTFVSLCRESNAPLAVVESIVGHSNPAMTRHYTHVGELATSKAVAALPAIIGEPTPQKEAQDLEAVLREARSIVRSLTRNNWSKTKSALLALLPESPKP